jgi:hypothetical protein
MTPIIPHIEYTPSQIVHYGWIGKAENTAESDYRYVLRLINRGVLQARNVCLTGQKYFKVKGEDIIRYTNAS